MVYTITVHLRANAEPSSVEKLKAKLIEASRIYSKDKETISWFVMQSTSDPRAFTIVERYEQESVSLGGYNVLALPTIITNSGNHTEPEVSPGESLLANFRSLRDAPLGREWYGLETRRGARHIQGCRRPCLDRFP